MKKLVIILVVLLFAQTGFGQNYVVFKTDTFNCIDNNGLKQGLWRDYDIYYSLDDSPMWFNDNGKLVEATYHRDLLKIIDSSLVIKKEGYFKNDKKIGVWEYFNHGGCFSSTTKVESYNEDGSYELKEIDFKVTYNADSSLITGMTTFLKDTISLNCLNNLCKTSFGNNTLYQFRQNSNDIDIEIIKIVGMVYYREIERIKALK